MYKDVTRHSRDEKERKTLILENDANGIIFRVHKHIYYGEQWLLTCRDLDIDKKELGTDDLEEAKKKGIVEITNILDAKIQKFQKALEALKIEN